VFSTSAVLMADAGIVPDDGTLALFGSAAAISAGAATDLWPVTLAEAKSWLKEESDDNDDLITGMVRAAAVFVETLTGMKLRAGNVDQVYPGFATRLVLYRRPLNAITAVEYDDGSTGEAIQLDASGYRLREFAGQPCLVPPFGGSFPTAERLDGAVRVSWSAGDASNADVPDDIKTAVKQMVSHWFINREAVALASGSFQEVPMGAQMLLMNYRRGFVG
jgi:uncharacterized phiE125 gp8 family phage protein